MEGDIRKKSQEESEEQKNSEEKTGEQNEENKAEENSLEEINYDLYDVSNIQLYFTIFILQTLA